MTYSQAMNIVDGIDVPEDEDQIEEAWEYLVSSELIYTLPDRYGRTAEALGLL